MRKNIKKVTAMLAFAALLGAALGNASTASAQSKTSRDRQESGSGSKSDRNRAKGDSGNFNRAQAEHFENTNKKNQDRNDRAPSKSKPRR